LEAFLRSQRRSPPSQQTPNGFKDNVVQLCSTDAALDATRLRERAIWLGRQQRRKSVLDRCAILDDFP